MRQWKRGWRWSALGALGLLLGGCSEIDRSCADDTACLESEICDLDAGLCVQLCTNSQLCPETAPTCESLGPMDVRKICKCKKDKCGPVPVP